jgi:virulence-associated protein VagC
LTYLTSVTSPEGIRRCTGSAATLPADTTTFTVAKVRITPCGDRRLITPD